jgi:signal transduction histidine kinase
MRKLIFGILLLAVVGIGLLHVFTPGELVFFHDTYRRLSYFPIAVGAILFGITGGLTLAVLTSVAFIPHIILYMGAGTEAYLSELTEILLYLAVAVVIGFIASKERQLREEYELLSAKLKRSYARLHSETELLIEVEEQLKTSQKLSILGQLSASLAHEIKNPLGSIKGTAEILLDDFPETHPKHEFVKILVQEVDRLNMSVDEVLLFSRHPQNIEQKKDWEPLAKVIKRVYKLAQNRIDKKKLSFILAEIDVCEDEARIIRNACDATCPVDCRSQCDRDAVQLFLDCVAALPPDATDDDEDACKDEARALRDTCRDGCNSQPASGHHNRGKRHSRTR